MKRIVLKRFHHREAHQIGIAFDFDASVKADVKTFDGVRWSQTHRMFYVADQAGNSNKLISHLRAKGYYVDYTALRQPAVKAKMEVDTGKPSGQEIYLELPENLQKLLQSYVRYLRGKRLSESTVRTYGHYVLRFVHFHRATEPAVWTYRHAERFMEDVITAENYSINSHRQCVGALKYLAELNETPLLDGSKIERPKRDKVLPTVLSKEEVLRLLQVTRNLKHRAALALLYSCGLRIGELLSLELKNIDFERGMLMVKKGKGRKDRAVALAEVIKPLVFNYLNTYKPRQFFIEGADGEVYSASSVRAFLRQSCRMAKIKKTVTPHTLRHSYATHMLENGVDIRYIQELLGHAKPETTMIYTHVAQKDLMKIKNPLDAMVLQFQANGKREQNMLLSGGL